MKPILIVFTLTFIFYILCFTYHNDYILPETFPAEKEIYFSKVVLFENNCPISQAQTENIRVSNAYLLQRENMIRQKLGKYYGKKAIDN